MYILANKSRDLYVGVTNNLARRMYEHVFGFSMFTAKCRVHRLVYFEKLGTPIAAIRREKRIKAMVRQEKVAMIEAMNPR